MASKLQKAIGAVKDTASIALARLSTAPYTSLEVAVLRATTHDDLPIDQVSVDQVLRLVSSHRSHAAACVRAIARRIGRTQNWVVALKSLLLVLRIFQHGDPYFPREALLAMRRGSRILNLSSFRDSSNSPSPWDFTSFVRTYALYLDERLECFLTGKLIHRRRAESPTTSALFRDMKPAALLDRIACWQQLLDRAVGTRPTGPAQSNRLVRVALHAVVRESFDLYREISDGLGLLLDSFFHLQLQNCVGATQACARAAKQFQELSEFYAACKKMGVGRSSEYPSVQTISEELLHTLQEFLKDQSSFPPTPAGKVQPLPTCDGSLENETTDPRVGQQSMTSLEDLINNAPKSRKCPAISIDLEAYGVAKKDNMFGTMSEMGSTHSLPVANSMDDLMTLWEWCEEEEREQKLQKQPQEQQQEVNNSKNWELILTETISQPATVMANQNTSAGWEMVLFEATQPAQKYSTQGPTLNVMMMPGTKHYNPFLQDTFQATTMPPTFQAIPSLPWHSTLNQISLMYNDPFTVPSCGRVLSGSDIIDEQNLLLEQQSWLRNQNRIIAKHMA